MSISVIVRAILSCHEYNNVQDLFIKKDVFDSN